MQRCPPLSPVYIHFPSLPLTPPFCVTKKSQQTWLHAQGLTMNSKLHAQDLTMNSKGTRRPDAAIGLQGQQATLVQIGLQRPTANIGPKGICLCKQAPGSNSALFRQQITRYALERGYYWNIRMFAGSANTGQAQDLYVTGLLQSQDLILRELCCKTQPVRQHQR